MLVLHHQSQHLCPRCGRLAAHPAVVCPSCGMSLALPWSAQRSGSNLWEDSPPLVVSHPPHFLPLIVEMLLNCIGIYGVGWLMLGQLAPGLALLLVSLLLWPVVFLLTIVTLGAGLICLGSGAIGVMVVNFVLLQQAIKRNAR